MEGPGLLGTEFGKAGYDFAKALARRDYASAHSMLSFMQRMLWSPNSIGQRFEEMIAYGAGDADDVEAIEGYVDYRSKKEGDIGGVYVAISGPGFSEAVMVFVKREEGEPKIREIEWGRP